MTNAHKRRKQPDVVRRALLEHGARLLVEKGMASVTVRAVSEAAGVTKGGFTHHFPHKQALVDAIFYDLLEDFGKALRDRARVDPISHGSFTRAYVNAAFDAESDDKTQLWLALSILLINEPSLRQIWVDALASWMEQVRDTEGGIRLTMIRLAADGVWLADFIGNSLPDRTALREEMTQATYPDGRARHGIPPVS